jgi:Flp pilus assembly pilin Flp
MALEFVALYVEVALGRLRAARRPDGAAGQAMVEYGVILAVVAMVVVVALTQLSSRIGDVLNGILPGK